MKPALTTKFGEVNYTIVIIGAHSNDMYPDSSQIDHKNWQSYEIARNNEKENGLVLVKIDKSYNVPDETYGVGAEWVSSFNQNDIVGALEKVKK